MALGSTLSVAQPRPLGLTLTDLAEGSCVPVHFSFIPSGTMTLLARGQEATGWQRQAWLGSQGLALWPMVSRRMIRQERE